MDRAAASDLTPHDAVVFQVDEAPHTWGQVFALARRRGDRAVLETEVRQALACQTRAVADERPLDPDRERATAVAFRRARRLHAAEDLEAWLAARGLSVAQWRRYVRGEALRRRDAADLDVVVGRHPVDAAAVEELAPIWGLCSGTFGRWVEELANRVAVAHALHDQGVSGPVPEVDDLDALEQRFDHFHQVVATPDRLASLVSARYLDWLRIDCEIAAFTDLDTAAEARLCIRDDGWTLRQAVRAAGARLRRRAPLAEEVEEDQRHRFVRAHEDDLLGPLPLDGRPSLVHVLNKRAPTLDDDVVRLRATRHLVDTAVTREVNDRVTWLHPR